MTKSAVLCYFSILANSAVHVDIECHFNTGWTITIGIFCLILKALASAC